MSDVRNESVSNYSIGSDIVCASHGVGRIVNIEKQHLYGVETQYYKISFPQNDMLITIPIAKAEANGLRPLTEKRFVPKVYQTLTHSASKGAKAWSRKIQGPIEEKIKSGNIMRIAEVVRDLYRKSNQDRSYSERILYEDAIKLLAGELSVVEKFDLNVTLSRIESSLLHKLIPNDIANFETESQTLSSAS